MKDIIEYEVEMLKKVSVKRKQAPYSCGDCTGNIELMDNDRGFCVGWVVSTSSYPYAKKWFLRYESALEYFNMLAAKYTPSI